MVSLKCWLRNEICREMDAVTTAVAVSIAIIVFPSASITFTNTG